MAMSDCEKCWETPCACGHEYKTYPLEKLTDVYKVIRAELINRNAPIIAEEIKKVNE